MKTVVLKPIREDKNLVEKIKEQIIELLRKEVYEPLFEDLDLPVKFQNADDSPLIKAIKKGTITFHHGHFRGKFSAAMSKELQRLGAKWDKKTGSWRIQYQYLPVELRDTIDASKYRLEQKIKAIDKKLKTLVPEEIADKINVADLFNTSLWDLDKKFKAQAKAITVTPQFTKAERERIAEEYNNNMQLRIKGFLNDEIKRLRKQIDKNVMAGVRYENLITSLQASYGVTYNKAKFLARQETNLLTHKFHQIKAESIGAKEYMWQAVVGTPLHPTRKRHKELSGTIQSWDKPPVVTEPGEPVRRAHPGEDFNCRCIARLVIKTK